MLRRAANWFEVVVAIALVVFVVLLFANQPTRSEPATPEQVEAAGGVDGGTLFGRNCAGCHGGDRSGAIGPPLVAGRITQRFPEIADQIAVVADGRGAMPAFGGRLTDEEIVAIVTYTRT